jgi:hypothetical protein
MIFKFLNKIKRWFWTKQFILEEEAALIRSTSVTQENPRDVATRKRVAEAFKAQEAQMNARALKAHSATCLDPLTCDKLVCATWEPDKIVSKEVVSIEPGVEFKKSKMPDRQRVEWALDVDMKKKLKCDKINAQKHED